MRLNKKAALNLSVQAIVILVIAFVVLGLALTLTRYVFKIGMSKAGEAIDIIELESKPSPDNPITIPGKVTIGIKDTKELKIGVYNAKGLQFTNAVLAISDCIKAGANASVSSDILPSLTTISQTIGISESKGYGAILSENGLTAGNYICTLKVTDGTTDYEAKQFFLTVTP
jgi:hypothetical protein